MSARTIRLALALATSLALTGCTNPRPLHVVQASADRFYMLERYNDAIPELVEFNSRKPNDPEMRYKLGKSYINTENPKAAREHMNVAVDVAPTVDKYMDGYAEALLKSGESDQMLISLRQRTSDRGTVADYLRLGQFASRVGHADEALTALKTAARLDAGKSVGPQLALASFYASVNDKPNEIRRLRMATWIAPANIQANERLRELGEIPGPSQAIQPEEWAPITEGTPKK
jgi:tetratricopeptide (TPR) repeat protein